MTKASDAVKAAEKALPADAVSPTTGEPSEASPVLDDDKPAPVGPETFETDAIR